MPFAEYSDFEDCVSKNSDKGDPKAYCATIMRDVEKKNIEEVEEKSLIAFQIQLKDGKVVGTEGVLIDTKPDLYNDICTKACLKSMVNQINSRQMTMDIEHETFRGDPLTKSLNKAIIPISKITSAEYKDTGDGHAQVYIKDELNTYHRRYNEIAGSIQGAYLKAYSIAYVPKKVSFKSIGDTKFRILEDVALLNVTFTGVPVNTRAVMASVHTKSEEKSLDENRLNELVARFVNGDAIDQKDINAGFAIEAKSLGGGKLMAENSTNVKAEAKVVEATPDKKSIDFESRISAVEAAVKSLVDAQKKDYDRKEDKKMTEEEEEEQEKKKRAGIGETKALSEAYAELKAKFEAHEKILSSPQYKARSASMNYDSEKANIEASLKANPRAGPVDFIR